MTPQLAERFFAKIEMDPNWGCWLWSAAANDFGYGIIRVGGKNFRAHRLSWEFAAGRKIRPGMDLMHSCDVPACCNPDHLREGSRKENVADMHKKRRARPPRGGSHSRSKLSSDAVAAIRALLSAGQKQASIAEQYGVTPQAISAINVGKNWA